MVSFQRAALAAVLLRGVASQTQYGGNSVRVQPDPSIVESRAFPAPNVTLYSPAFALNASFPQGWTDGTAGATSEYTLRKPAASTDTVTHMYWTSMRLTKIQTRFSKHWLTRIHRG